MIPGKYLPLLTYGGALGVSTLAFAIASLNEALRLPMCALLALLVVALLSRDLAAHKDTEGAPRENAARLRALFEQLPIGVSLLDRNRKLVYANPALAEIVGLSRDALVKGEFAARQYIRADGTPMPPEEFASVRAVREQRAVHDVVTGIVTETGETIWTSVSAEPSPLTDEGVVIATVDITERKRAQQEIERLASFPRLNPNPILEVDATGTITFQNDATTALLMRLKQDARALLPPDLPEILQSFARQEAEMVCREVGIDGVILEENIHRVPQYNAARIYAIDITERKRAEELSQALNAINTVIHSTLNLDDIMQTAVSAAARALGCVSAAVSLRQQARWIVSYAHGFPQDIVGVEMNDQEEPHAVLAIQTKRVVAISDTNRDERVNRAHMQKWGIRATLVAPLITKDEVTGIAFFNYRQAPFVFEQRHLDFASQLAASLALALENARLYREARALNEELDQRVAQRTSELENVNRQLESAVAQHQRATEQLRQLAAHIESAREEERIRIAREIHDELGTLMTAIKMDLAFLRREIGGDGAPQSPQALREQIHATTKLVDNAIESVHQIARELRPGVLDHLGLRAALEWQMQEFQSRAKIECQFCSDLDELPVEPAHATAVFRILQEALTNVARHAQATRVEASLRKESTCLVLQVRDNGKGFSKAQIANGHALGLLGMRERALAFGGEVFFQTAPGQGTVVTVRLPLP